jgi:hypothetical protein
MTTQSVFETEQAALVQEETIPQEQEQQEVKPEAPESVFANQLAEIRNEKGEPKYRDLPTAIEALKHSQDYIPQLKSQLQQFEEDNKRLQDELNKRATVEDTIQRLQSSKANESGDPARQLSQEDILSVVEQYMPQYMLQRDTAQKAQTNAQQVEQSLRQAYGDQVTDVVRKKATDLGITPEKLGEMAKESPQLVLSLFELKAQSTPKTMSSSVNIPPTNRPSEGLQRPEKSLLLGASTKSQMEYMNQVRAAVHKRNGITS